MENTIGAWQKLLPAAISAMVASLLGLFPSHAVSAEEIIEEVVVTGSRIATTNETASQPLLTIGAEAITSSGQVDLAELLNDVPQLTSSITLTNSLDGSAATIGGTNNFGASALDLRGLGTERTLTLVNGRRHVAGVAGTSAVDVTTLPAALVERIEVLSGGASAIYGSDALTGVVNFVLKDDFEGLEFAVQTGSDEHMGNGTSRLSLVGGKSLFDGRGNITFALQFDTDDGMLMGERGFLANNSIVNDGNNPALRFQKGDISAGATPALANYYNFANTGLFPWGLRIPGQDTFIENYTEEFGAAPTLNAAETALFAQAAGAPPRALLPGYTFNITSPYGVVAAGDFGVEVPLGSEPDLDGNGVSDCLDSFTGYNSSLDGAGAFGIAGGCWVIGADGTPRPYTDGLVAGSFNHFGASDSYIRPNDIHAIPESESRSIDLIGSFDISDTSELFFEAKYISQEVSAIEQYHNFTDLLHGLPDNPYLPAGLADLADNEGLGFADIGGGLHISRDSMDWGPNVTTNKKETFRVVYGFRGDLTDAISYEASINYGQYNREMIDTEEMIADRFFAAIDAVIDPATGEPACRSSVDPTAYPKTTPFNIFQFTGGGTRGSFFTFAPGDGQCQPMNIWGGAGAMSQASIDFVTYDRELDEEIKQIVYSGIVTGDTSGMFELPGGAIGFAAGIEFRDEISSQTFGELDQGIIQVDGVTSDGVPFVAGNWVGDLGDAKSLGPQPSTRLVSSYAQYDFLDYFVEVKLPILSDVPGFYDLNAELAYRSSDNSIFGDNDTYKYGLVWSPIQDISFRYTFSDATRVPNLYELFSPEQGARFRPDDPCASNNISSAEDASLRQANCVTDLRANGVAEASIFDDQGNYVFEDPLSAGFPGAVGGNENLQPESGETTSYGVVIAPRFVEGLVLSVDFIEIDIADAIVSVSAQNIVNRCYDSPTLANSFCPLISRNDDPSSAQSGGLDYLRQVQLNFGAAIFEAFDATASYSFTVGDFDITSSVKWTTVDTLDFIEQGGEVDNELGEMRRPEESATAAISLSTGSYKLDWSTNYLGKQTLHYEGGVEIETAVENYGPGVFTDGTTLIHNARLSYSTGELSVFGGVNNLTNESPYVTERAYPVSPIGRFFYVGAKISL